MLAEMEGISHTDLIGQIIRSAMKRYANPTHLSRVALLD